MTRSKAWSISHRSGLKFPHHEMIQEPLTGFLIHKSESDGYFEIEERHRRKQLQFNDPIPLEVIRPDSDWVLDIYLQDEDQDYITDSEGTKIEIN